MNNYINENGKVQLTEEARLMFHRPATDFFGRPFQDEKVGKRKKRKITLRGGINLKTQTVEIDLTYTEKEN